ncbi:hypothetical protein ABFX02_12G080800 [Erythranthe guttata]
MSFSGGKRPLNTPSPPLVLIIVLLVHILISGQHKAVVVAIRKFPQRTTLSAAVEESEGQTATEYSPPAGKINNNNQTEVFKDYFYSRISDLNSTTNGTFVDSKRRIPSCPDALHN